MIYFFPKKAIKKNVATAEESTSQSQQKSYAKTTATLQFKVKNKS
jgi:hypothetical protein